MAAGTSIIETILKLRGSREFQREADKSARAVGGIGTSAETAGKQAGQGWKGIAKWGGSAAAIGGAGLYIKTATNAAVDLNEEINKTGVVFRGSSPELISWSKNAATSLGMAQQEALSAMGTFGNMLVPMGLGRDQAAQMSQRMVSLAADMASFNNASPADTLDALRAGLAGESEPLRRYGVFLSDARLKQQAMSMGLYKGKGILDANAKAQATYALILKDTKDAQGDFARTSDSLANKQRILKAQWTDMAANLGTALLPVAQKLASLLSKLAEHTTALYITLGLLTAGFLALKTAQLAATLSSLGFTAAMVRQRIATLLATLAMTGFNVSVLLIPLAIALVIGALVLLYLKCEWFRNAVQAAMRAVVAAFKWVGRAAMNVFNWIKEHWPLLVAILTGPLGLATYAVAKNFDKLKQLASDAVHFIADRFRALVAFVKRIPGEIVKAAKGAAAGGLKAAGGLVKSVVPGIQTGGTILRSGAAIVGERGPELVHLPAGATVFSASETAAAGSGSSLEPERLQPIQLVVDGRVLAQSVARVASDSRARR